MMRTLVFFVTLCAVASGQSMRQGGAVLAGTTVGSAAGKKVSDGIDARLKKTSKALDTASKTGTKQDVPTPPLLQVGAGVPAGVPKAEANNVPPPPPRRIAAAPKPAKPRAVSVPMVMSAVIPEGPPPAPVNVDLAGFHNGMDRDSALALGNPSARITMYEDGHLMEIYQYRNQTLASGTVRLRDGAVWAIEARP
jgi:hypothetical protein